MSWQLMLTHTWLGKSNRGFSIFWPQIHTSTFTHTHVLCIPNFDKETGVATPMKHLPFLLAPSPFPFTRKHFCQSLISHNLFYFSPLGASISTWTSWCLIFSKKQMTIAAKTNCPNPREPSVLIPCCAPLHGKTLGNMNPFTVFMPSALFPLRVSLYPPLTHLHGAADKLCEAISKSHISALVLPRFPGTLKEVTTSSSIKHFSFFLFLFSVTPHTFLILFLLPASFFSLFYVPLLDPTSRVIMSQDSVFLLYVFSLVLHTSYVLMTQGSSVRIHTSNNQKSNLS